MYRKIHTDLTGPTGKTLCTIKYANNTAFQLEDIFEREDAPLQTSNQSTAPTKHPHLRIQRWKASTDDLSRENDGDDESDSTPIGQPAHHISQQHAIDCTVRMHETFGNLIKLAIVPPQHRHLQVAFKQSLSKSLYEQKPSIYWTVWLVCQLLEELVEDEEDAELLKLISKYRGNLLTPTPAARIDLDRAILQKAVATLLNKLAKLTSLPTETAEQIEPQIKSLAKYTVPGKKISLVEAVNIISGLIDLSDTLEACCEANAIDHADPIAQTTLIVTLTVACLHSSKQIYQDFI